MQKDKFFISDETPAPRNLVLAAIKYGALGIILFGVFSSFVPRGFFLLSDTANLTKSIINWWPKMAKDFQTLSTMNASFSFKYVFLCSAIAIFVLFVALGMSAYVGFQLAKQKVVLSRKGTSTSLLLQTIGVICFLVWFIFILPTPFVDSSGFSTRFPRSELGVVYFAAFCAALYIVLFGMFVRLWVGLLKLEMK
jgi:hypothetical protein